MSNVRKASDILLELEATLERIVGYVHNMDMNIKTMSNRLGALEKNVSAAKWSPPSMAREEAVIENKPPTQMPGLKPGVQIGPQRSMVTTPKGQISAAEGEEVTFIDDDQLKVDNQSIGLRRGIRTGEPDTERKMPVQQRIIYQDGKNVCLANVEIFQTDKKGQLELIKKVRTNSAGKWAVALVAGKYLVNISKIGTSTKPTVEVSYEIDIPISAAPLELPPFSLGKQQSR